MKDCRKSRQGSCWRRRDRLGGRGGAAEATHGGIRWCEGNLLASPYFPRTGGKLVDWIDPVKVEANGKIVDMKVSR